MEKFGLKWFLILYMLILPVSTMSVLGQRGFRFSNSMKRDKISFKLLNNLVVIPITVNGKELSFILDTGARHSLLFSLSEIDSLEIKNVTPIKIRGLGSGGTIDALKSSDNQLAIGGAVDRSHTLYVIFDEAINFSPRMGIPIHGVLGYEFFKDFVVKLDYSSEKITFYDPLSYEEKACRKCETFELFLNDNKPYIFPRVTHGGVTENVTLLLDSGSSDALWLFDENKVIDEVEINYFEDFLGYGISGGIYGKRSKLHNFSIGSFNFNKVTVAFPNPDATKEIVMYEERDGSLGGEILKRFTVIMDYRTRKITLKKNRFYDDPFHYNMAGIVVEHDGAVTVKSFMDEKNTFTLEPNQDSANDAIEIKVNPILNFFLAPRYVVSEVRKDSPADLADIRKGDEVVSINGKQAYKYKLYEIVELFSSKENRKITIEIQRDGKLVKRKFILKELI